MAITLTHDELANALGLDDADTNVERLRRVARVVIEKRAPNAPQTIQNESAIRLCGYLMDQPFAPQMPRYTNALRNSGADALLQPYRTHRAALVGNGASMADDADVVPETPVVDTPSGDITSVVMQTAWTPYDTATDPRIVFDTATYDFEIDTQGIEGKNVEFDPPDSTEEGYQYFVFPDTYPDLIAIGLLPGGTGIGLSGFEFSASDILGFKTYRSTHLLSGALTSRFTWFLSWGNF